MWLHVTLAAAAAAATVRGILWQQYSYMYCVCHEQAGTPPYSRKGTITVPLVGILIDPVVGCHEPSDQPKHAELIFGEVIAK